MKRMPDNSCAQLRRNTLVLSLLTVLVTFLPGCGLLPLLEFLDPSPFCSDDIGECPPPDPGVLVNTAGFQKFTWVQDDRIGEPGVAQNVVTSRTFCFADLDSRPGEEFVFWGSDGMIVISIEGGSPNVLSFIPVPVEYYRKRQPSPTTFLDVTGDGESEYLDIDYGCEITDEDSLSLKRLRLWDHTGSLLWQRCLDYLSPEGFRILGEWERADTDGDGVEEFAITTAEGVELITAEGSRLATIGGTSYSDIAFADLDGDMSLKLVTQVPSYRGGQIAIWDLDGAQAGEFVPEDPKLRFKIVRIPERNDRDFIALGCQVYDSDGTPIDTLEPDDQGVCRPEVVDYASSLIESACPSVGLEGEYPDEFVRFDESVRVAADSDPYRAEFTYSIEIDYPYFNGPIGYRSYRTILKIYDPTDELVYHEVISTESNPGSFLVIPSDVPGEEVLLVADGTRILAYFLGEMNQN